MNSGRPTLSVRPSAKGRTPVFAGYAGNPGPYVPTSRKSWVLACAGTNGERARHKFGIARAIAIVAALFFSTATLAQAPMPSTKIQLVPFETSPFPYSGPVPDKNMTFLDVVNGERHGHTSLRGGVYWQDLTYSDKRALLAIPRGFDIRRPAVIVVFFHGNLATLPRDVRNRQQVPRQVEQSGLNAVLVAP